MAAERRESHPLTTATAKFYNRAGAYKGRGYHSTPFMPQCLIHDKRDGGSMKVRRTRTNLKIMVQPVLGVGSRTPWLKLSSQTYQA